jgi:hypothetical protein
MSLKPEYNTDADIPAEHKAFYKQEGTKWLLDVEGDLVPAATAESYRAKNIELMKERDNVIKPALRAYEDVGTLDDFRHLKNIRDQLDESKLVRSNKLDEAVEKRVATMRDEYEKKLKKETEKATEIKARYAIEKIDKEIISVATKLGAKPTALEDIVARLRNRVKMDDDGKVITFMADGVTRYYGKSGDTAASMEELVTELQPNTPHLFEDNRGLQTEPGKQTTSPRPGGFSGANPWKKESHNLTMRMKIAKENPELAKKLRAEAGVVEIGAVG